MPDQPEHNWPWWRIHRAFKKADRRHAEARLAEVIAHIAYIDHGQNLDHGPYWDRWNVTLAMVRSTRQELDRLRPVMAEADARPRDGRSARRKYD